MPLDQAQLDLIKKEIEAYAAAAQTYAGVFAPEIIPLILLGKGLAVLAPDLVKDVQDWLDNDEPSDADNAALAAKIAALGNPEDL